MYKRQLDPQKCIAKVGLQLFISEGPKVLEFLSHKGFEIFLDLKLHDIPNTVKKSVEEISKYNVKLTTIHLQGGRDMIQAANQAKGDTKILGVSLLTSLDDSDTRELYNNDFKKQFDNLIDVAMETKMDGIVCSIEVYIHHASINSKQKFHVNKLNIFHIQGFG